MHHNFANCAVQVCVWSCQMLAKLRSSVRSLFSEIMGRWWRVWYISNNIHCFFFPQRELFCALIAQVFSIDLLTIKDLHTYRGWCWKMYGWFSKVTTTQQVSGIKCSVYCLPVLHLGKKKNNLLLINTGHLAVCLSRLLSQPALIDPTLLCIWCFLGWKTWWVFHVRTVWYSRYRSCLCVFLRLFPPALPEILPPDYRLARMTAAAFHTNAVNT